MKKTILIATFVYFICLIALPSIFMMMLDFLELPLQSFQVHGLYRFKIQVYLLIAVIFIINLIVIFILKISSIRKVIISFIISISGLLAGVALNLYMLKGSAISFDELNFLSGGILGAIVLNLLFIVIEKPKKSQTVT